MASAFQARGRRAVVLTLGDLSMAVDAVVLTRGDLSMDRGFVVLAMPWLSTSMVCGGLPWTPSPGKKPQIPSIGGQTDSTYLLRKCHTHVTQ